MDSYKRNRIIGLIGIGLIVLILAAYIIWTMTSDNNRYVDVYDYDDEPTFVAEMSGPFEYTTFNLPVGYSKYKSALDDISLFASFDPDYVLSRLPKKIENIVFSDDGQKAVVFESDVVSFYDVAENSMTEIIALQGGWGSGIFTKDFYTIGYDEASKKDALKVVNLEEGTVDDLIYFIRNIEEYEITATDDVLFLVDRTNLPNILYVIDTVNASRTNVYEDYYIELGDANGALLAFAAGETQFNPSVKYLDYIADQINDFAFDADILNFAFDNAGSAYFVSDTEYSSGRFYKSESDIVTVKDLTSSYAEPKTLGLYKWDGAYSLVMDLSEQVPAAPDRIEVRDNVVRMLVGEEYFDVKII